MSETCREITETIPGETRTYTKTVVTEKVELDWSAGARSVESFRIGTARFMVPSFSMGAAVGLATQDRSTSPEDILAGVLCSGGTYRVVEAGHAVGPGIPYDGGSVFEIRRSIDGTVRLFVGGVLAHTYATTIPASSPTWLDAALFASGDVVFDAAIVLGGSVDASMRPMAGVLTEEGVETATVYCEFAPMTADIFSGNRGSVEAVMAPMRAVLAETGEYALVDAGMRPMEVGYMGYEPSFALVDAVVAPMASSHIGMAGVVGSVDTGFYPMLSLSGRDTASINTMFRPMLCFMYARGFGVGEDVGDSVASGVAEAGSLVLTVQDAVAEGRGIGGAAMEEVHDVLATAYGLAAAEDDYGYDLAVATGHGSAVVSAATAFDSQAVAAMSAQAPSATAGLVQATADGDALADFVDPVDATATGRASTELFLGGTEIADAVATGRVDALFVSGGYSLAEASAHAAALAPVMDTDDVTGSADMLADAPAGGTEIADAVTTGRGEAWADWLGTSIEDAAADGAAQSVLLFRDETRITWVMNTESTALSWYSGLPLGQIAQLDGGRVLAVGDDGLCALDAQDDIGEPIHAGVTFGLLDLGDEKMKRCEALYLGYRSDGELSVQVETVESGHPPYRYRMPAVRAEFPRNNRMLIGRGLRGRYWRFDIDNIDGADFAVHSVSLDAAAGQRRIY